MFNIENKRNAYIEILEVLKRLDEKDYNKIPSDIIEKFKNESNKEYSFKYDDTKDLNEQSLMEETKVYLAILFKRYWATDEQKEKINAYHEKTINENEKIKKEKYDSDNIFKNTDITTEKKITDINNKNDNENIEKLELVEIPKKNFLQKIIDFFRKK